MRKMINHLLGAVLSLLVIGAAAPRAHAQDGTLVFWGDNGSDDYDGYGRVSRTPAGTFIAVAAGALHSVAIKTDGTLVSWGGNTYGQVSSTPAGTFSSVAAGYLYSVAIKTDGTLAAWGNDGYGVLSDIPPGTFIAVAAGTEHSVAIRMDGTLVSWGNNFFDRVSGTPAGTFTAVAAGGAHNVAIRTDGTLVSWGYNGDGVVSGTPAGTFTAVAAGLTHYSVAIKTDGTLVSWGNDDAGQVRGTPAGTFTAVAAGFYFSGALGTPDNQAPVANAGADITASACSGPTSLDGSLSSDPNGDMLAYAWYEGNTLLATGVNPAVTLNAGAHTITLIVTDPSGVSSSDTVVVTISPFASDAIVWHQPLARNGASEDTDPSAGRTVKYRFKRGSTIPIQIHALGCTADVTANANVIGKVTVFGDTNCDGAMDDNAVPIDFNGVGGGGGVMDKIGGYLKYNLDTKVLPTTTRCYILRVTVTDTSTGEEKFEEVLLQAK